MPQISNYCAKKMAAEDGYLHIIVLTKLSPHYSYLCPQISNYCAKKMAAEDGYPHIIVLIKLSPHYKISKE